MNCFQGNYLMKKFKFYRDFLSLSYGIYHYEPLSCFTGSSQAFSMKLFYVRTLYYEFFCLSVQTYEIKDHADTDRSIRIR